MPTPTPISIITGITGQDGSYLAEFLASKDYIIYGLVRQSSSSRLDRLSLSLRAYAKLILKGIDLTDSVSIYNLLKEIKASHFSSDSEHVGSVLEIYNLAAQSHVKVSFDTPEYTTNVDAIGPLRFLEAVRQNDLVSVTRICQAGTSELFGKAEEVPQRETTPFYPRSPYGVAKLYAHWIVKNYRESYGMFACNSICFNHESPRRGEEFSTRKITLGVARLVKDSMSPPLELGNIDSKRDWGFAGDYIKGIWLMLQQSTPDDYVLATGKTHTIREFVEAAFKVAGVTIEWRGSGKSETGHDIVTGRTLVCINPCYYRPCEVDLLIGDATKARLVLGWTPMVDFEELVQIMVKHDLDQ
jgi:GDPmannose 4,6-dehydratase